NAAGRGAAHQRRGRTRALPARGEPAVPRPRARPGHDALGARRRRGRDARGSAEHRARLPARRPHRDLSHVPRQHHRAPRGCERRGTPRLPLPHLRARRCDSGVLAGRPDRVRPHRRRPATRHRGAGRREGHGAGLTWAGLRRCEPSVTSSPCTRTNELENTMRTPTILATILLTLPAALHAEAPERRTGTFAVHCYDVGRATPTGLPGVVAVESGW